MLTATTAATTAENATNELAADEQEILKDLAPSGTGAVVQAPTEPVNTPEGPA